MRGGYVVSEGEQVRAVAEGEGGAAFAAQALADLRAIVAAPQVRITALPFAMPELPSLYGGGLADDVDVQLEHGREVTASFLQAFTTSGVLASPGGGARRHDPPRPFRRRHRDAHRRSRDGLACPNNRSGSPARPPPGSGRTP